MPTPGQIGRMGARKTMLGGGLSGVQAGATGLAGRQGKLGRMTRRVAKGQAAGRDTGALQAKLGRTLERRTEAGRNVFASGAQQQARGQRFMRRLSDRTAGR